MGKLTAFIRFLLSGIFALLLLLNTLFWGEPSVASGGAVMTRSLRYGMRDGITFNQGLACDGETYYGTGAFKFAMYNVITKIDMRTGEILQRNEMCLPWSLVRRGYAHVGDCCLHGGRLYVALEDFGFRNPGVAVYNPQTLEFIDFKPVPKEARGNGRIPWCAVSDDGILYFTQSNEVNELRMLRADDMTYLGAMPLDPTLYKVQGGELLNGRMIMVTNEGIREKNIYTVDLQTGHVEVLFVRCTGNADAEGEGIAVSPAADGSVLHIIDSAVTAVRIGSYALT